MLAAIVRALELQPEELVCEVGPGTGRLTERLITAAGIEQVRCVEMDRDMVAHLAERHPSLSVIQADAAGVDWETITGGSPATVCGNLPYNASTAIYFHLLLVHRHLFRRFVLMFQREVAERLLAGPGSKRFGAPSVMTAVLAEARKVTHVPPSAFRPRPKVDSTVIAVTPRPTPHFGVREDEVEALRVFVRAAFKQRRKTIANNLKPLVGPTAGAQIEALGVDPRTRAEALPVSELVRLWRHVVGNPP